MEKNIPLLQNQTLPDCFLHKGNPLKWVCLEKSCDRRLFCEVCVIQDHKNVHSNFTHIYQTLNDPLLSFQNFEFSWGELTKQFTIREKFEDFIKKEEDKLDELFNNIVFSLSSRFDKLKKQFREDLIEFLKSKQDLIDSIEIHRKDYKEFLHSYFPGIDAGSYEQLKETLEIVLTRYFSDSDINEKFKATINAIPLVKRKETYNLKLNDLAVDMLKWNTFTNKGISIPQVSQHTFNRVKTCGDMTFSNGDTTVKKNGGAHGSTVLGNIVMEEGVYEWKMQVNEVNGSYFCLGMISVKDWDVKADQWASALCVCSDKHCYGGLAKTKGEISLMPGDVITFKLDLGENKFTVIGHEEKFECEMKGIIHQSYTAFVSYPPYAQSKISFV